MPIEIRELILRATVVPEKSADAARPDHRKKDSALDRALSPAELERVVSLCAARVLRSIRRVEER